MWSHKLRVGEMNGKCRFLPGVPFTSINGHFHYKNLNELLSRLYGNSFDFYNNFTAKSNVLMEFFDRDFWISFFSNTRLFPLLPLNIFHRVLLIFNNLYLSEYTFHIWSFWKDFSVWKLFCPMRCWCNTESDNKLVHYFLTAAWACRGKLGWESP